MDFLNTLYYNHLKKISIPEKNREYLLKTTPLKHKAHLLFNFLQEDEREKLFEEGMKELNFEILSLFSYKKFKIEFLLKNSYVKGCFKILLNYIKNTERPPSNIFTFIHNREDILEILKLIEDEKVKNSDDIFNFTNCCEKNITWIRLFKKYDIKIKKYDYYFRKVNIEQLKNYILKGDIYFKEDEISILRNKIKKLEINASNLNLSNASNLNLSNANNLNSSNANNLNSSNASNLNSSNAKKVTSESINDTPKLNNAKIKKPLFKRKLKLFNKKPETPYNILNLLECTNKPDIFQPTEKFTDDELEIFKKKNEKKVERPSAKINLPQGIFDYKKNVAIEIPMKKFKLTSDDLIMMVREKKSINLLLLTVLYENWPTEKEQVLLTERENLTFSETVYRKLLELEEGKKYFTDSINKMNEKQNGEIFTETIRYFEKNLQILENKLFMKFISLSLQLENQLSKKNMNSFKISSLFTAINKKALSIMKNKINLKLLSELLEPYKNEISFANLKILHKDLNTENFNGEFQQLEKRLLGVENYIGEKIDEEFNKKIEILKGVLRSC